MHEPAGHVLPGPLFTTHTLHAHPFILIQNSPLIQHIPHYHTSANQSRWEYHIPPFLLLRPYLPWAPFNFPTRTWSYSVAMPSFCSRGLILHINPTDNDGASAPNTCYDFRASRSRTRRPATIDLSSLILRARSEFINVRITHQPLFLYIYMYVRRSLDTFI